MIQFSPLFSDGAVFQRRMSIPVWGVTDPCSSVNCVFDGITVRCIAGYDGAFFFRLPAHEAGGPYELTLNNEKTGESITVRDILVGEVWLASGQSNMEFKMQDSPQQQNTYLAMKKDPETFRMFTVPKQAKVTRERICPGVWKKAEPENIPDFSAVATWFAEKLRDELNVPVGIIHSSWGGTIAEAWTSRNTLMRNLEFRSTLLAYDEVLQDTAKWENVKELVGNSASWFKLYCTPDLENKGEKEGWHKPDFDDCEWIDFELPGSWTARKLSGNGTVWIRAEIELPADFDGKDVLLNLGPIDKQDITYFNGEEVGRTGSGFEDKYWNTARQYKVPGRLVHVGTNVIAIRAYSFMYDGCYGGVPERYTVELPGTGKSVCYAGLVRFKTELDAGTVIFPWMQGIGMGPGISNSAAMLFDSMIRPLIPYAIQGVIWYQGESNAGNVQKARFYEKLISDMIRDWRFWWEQGDFPFIQVHLAGFRDKQSYQEDSVWAPLRESQRRAAIAVGNCGLISAIDAGDVADIHPKDKITVGERLAAWALRNVYSRDVPSEGPSFRELRQEGSRIRVVFDNCFGGLVTNDGRKPDDFMVAGQDGVFYPAAAEIDGNSILLTSESVTLPQKVRFAWADFPKHLNLYNKAGLPAMPFEA